MRALDRILKGRGGSQLLPLVALIRGMFRNGEQGVWYEPGDFIPNWRRNLLTRTGEFENAAWMKVNTTITAAATTAPDGTLTADKLVETVSSVASHDIRISSGSSPANSVISVYAKASERRYVKLYSSGVGASTYFFDLVEGVVSPWTTGTGAQITDVGNGWFRLSVPVPNAVSNSISFLFGTAIDSVGNHAGDGTSGIFLWGAQLEVGSTASAYQRITDGVQDYYDVQPQPVLFQDSAGTTPVTAVEQPVGLMLDKSQGLVLGSEKIINGSFSSSSNWTLNTSVAIANSRAEFTSAAAGYLLFQDGGPQYYGNGRFYVIEFDYSTNVTISVFLSGTGVFIISPGTGRAKGYGFATNDTLGRFQINANAPSATGWIDNISVKELAGNHAFQSTSASRPVLSARVNLLTKTEQFDDSVWTKTNATVTANAETAPDGTLTADRLIEDTTASSEHRLRVVTIAKAASAVMTYSVYVKPNGRYFVLVMELSGNGLYTSFDVANNAYTDFSAATGWTRGQTTITPVGGGWYRCSISGTTDTGTSVNVRIQLGDVYPGVATPLYTGNGTSGIYLWGADLRPTNQATGLIPTYQRVNTSTDYDTAGFPLYLKFNGASSSMATNSINFTATDKMTVWAGVRKLSDAARGMVFELSNIFSNPGTFQLNAPLDTGYAFGSGGSAGSGVNAGPGYPAPFTAVLTGVGSISEDIEILRVNGVQAASDAGDQGTGNYGNYPLYLGARAGTSLFFNGNLYSLITRGAQSTAGQISSGEKYINSKTKAY